MGDKEKHIDVTASSLVDLKAELLRKQEQFRQQKLQNATNRSLSAPKKPNIWSKKNVGVLERAQNDLEQKTEEADVLDKARSALEAKARLYEQMSRSDTISDEDGSKHFLVDFELKNLTAQAERRKTQQPAAEPPTQIHEEDQKITLNVEEQVSDDPAEQWVDYVDSFGRSRRCLRKDLVDMTQSDKKTSNASKDRELMSADMRRELQRQEWEREAEEALSRPAGPVHYADVRYNEIRDHGVGFFEFAKDEETRRQQLEALKKLRQQTDEQRSRSETVKEKRKALLEARLAKVRQRKTIHTVPDLDLDVTTADDDVGPKLSEATQPSVPPEPLVRDETLRKTGTVREWDKGKTAVHDEESWLSARRSERPSEFAPPSVYATDATSVSLRPQRPLPAALANSRPQKRTSYGPQPHQQPNVVSSATDDIAAMLQSIRSDVEQSVTTVCGDSRNSAANGCLDELQNSAVDFTDTFDLSTAPSDGVSYNQTLWTDFSLDWTPSSENTAEQPGGSLSSSSDAINTVSLAESEAESVSRPSDDRSDSVGPQPAHYGAAPSGPQPKQPKYERIFVHDLPPTLPLPPTAGSASAQYPSQEEVIGPRRRKEPSELTEKTAIRNWYRQFDQQRTKPPPVKTSLEPDNKKQLLKPKNIPFASPYIQTNDASSSVIEDPAAKEFDPSKPPPTVKSSDL